MGLLKDITKNKVLTGVAIGVGASILLPKVMPLLAEAAKPLAADLARRRTLMDSGESLNEF